MDVDETRGAEIAATRARLVITMGLVTVAVMPSMNTVTVTVYEPGNSVFGRKLYAGPVTKEVFICVGPDKDQEYTGVDRESGEHDEKVSCVFNEMTLEGVTLSVKGRFKSNNGAGTGFEDTKNAGVVILRSRKSTKVATMPQPGCVQESNNRAGMLTLEVLSVEIKLDNELPHTLMQLQLTAARLGEGMVATSRAGAAVVHASTTLVPEIVASGARKVEGIALTAKDCAELNIGKPSAGATVPFKTDTTSPTTIKAPLPSKIKTELCLKMQREETPRRATVFGANILEQSSDRLIAIGWLKETDNAINESSANDTSTARGSLRKATFTVNLA